MSLRSVDDILKQSKSHALRMILETPMKHEEIEPARAKIIKQDKIKSLLITYCDPKPEFDGLTAWELAGKIMEAMK